MSQTFNNLIKFPLTQEFVDYWGQTSIAPLINAGYLEIRVKRKDYTLITDGTGIKTTRGYRNVFGEKQEKRIGFRVKIANQNEDLYLAMLELANYTAGESCDLQPIEVIDYCYRHNREDRDRCFRIREGVFEGEFSQVTGTVSGGYLSCDGTQNMTGNKYGSGFSFKFMETVCSNSYF